jgi:hypothetical protein
MRALVLILALALGACEQAPAVAPHGGSARGGWLYTAASETARSFTGAVNIERNALVFAKGALVRTSTIARRGAAEPISQGGPSFAAAALGPPDTIVELRAIEGLRMAQGAPSLCPNNAQPTYVGLAYSQRGAQVTLLIFSGSEAPGQSAEKTWLCATYVYTAPDGVRTRQGVLL